MKSISVIKGIIVTETAGLEATKESIEAVEASAAKRCKAMGPTPALAGDITLVEQGSITAPSFQHHDIGRQTSSMFKAPPIPS